MTATTHFDKIRFNVIRPIAINVMDVSKSSFLANRAKLLLRIELIKSGSIFITMMFVTHAMQTTTVGRAVDFFSFSINPRFEKCKRLITIQALSGKSGLSTSQSVALHRAVFSFFKSRWTDLKCLITLITNSFHALKYKCISKLSKYTENILPLGGRF